MHINAQACVHVAFPGLGMTYKSAWEVGSLEKAGDTVVPVFLSLGA